MQLSWPLYLVFTKIACRINFYNFFSSISLSVLVKMGQVSEKRKTIIFTVILYSIHSNVSVGAFHGNLPHVKYFGDQGTLMQIGIQATAR
jgi:hypothetical protein